MLRFYIVSKETPKRKWESQILDAIFRLCSRFVSVNFFCFLNCCCRRLHSHQCPYMCICCVEFYVRETFGLFDVSHVLLLLFNPTYFALLLLTATAPCSIVPSKQSKKKTHRIDRKATERVPQQDRTKKNTQTHT